MSVPQEILAWSTNLDPWQRDALRRLFTKIGLSEEDYDDLLALLKAEHGIIDPKGRTAVPLKADDIPAPSSTETPVRVIGIRNLKHVNRIAPSAQLTFGRTGLTLIYGENGTGKSGFSRVLKRACRARNQTEPIHPNAYEPAMPAAKPQATVDLEVSDAPKSIEWTEGQPGSDELATLAVFDAHCARSYLDEEGDVAFIPYGLDVLHGLADVCKRLRERLEAEGATVVVSTEGVLTFPERTRVADLIAGLTATTKPEEVESLATLSAVELARLNELEKSLGESNPQEAASIQRRTASRVQKISESTARILDAVDDAAVQKLQTLGDAYISAREAAELAAKAFQEDGGALPGTGGSAWKALFESARMFCAEADPTASISQLKPEDRCPLCQQELGDGALRLAHFDHFIQREAANRADAAAQQFNAAREAIKASPQSLIMDEETAQELEALSAPLVEHLTAYSAALKDRQAAIMASCEMLTWQPMQPLPASPKEKLDAFSAQLSESAATLEEAAKSETRAALEAERAELRARKGLSECKPAVLAAISGLALKATLATCAGRTKTNAISLKASELTEKAVSKALEDALNENFKALGVHNLKVTLKSRSVAGKTYHKLRLDLPQNKSPTDILSEGEQRAVAIGSFLAEAWVGDSVAGLVFDDPVSSLDHRRRELVARRLVGEAANRQVMILTHDLYFANLLLEEAEGAGCPLTVQTLTQITEGFGVTHPELPFAGMNTKQRIGDLRNRLPPIRKAFDSGDQDNHRKLTRDAYQDLRLAWERAVEEILLRRVVLRFRKGIETHRLAEAAIEDEDYHAVYAGMTKCSNYAHDGALLGEVAPPHPDELEQDIEDLDRWRSSVEKRAGEVRKRRKGTTAVVAKEKHEDG